MDFNEYLSVNEAAAMLDYTPANITRLIRIGKIKAVKRVRKYYIHVDEVTNFLMEG